MGLKSLSFVLFISGRSLKIDGKNTSKREKLKTSEMEGVGRKHRLRNAFSISFRNLSLTVFSSLGRNPPVLPRALCLSCRVSSARLTSPMYSLGCEHKPPVRRMWHSLLCHHCPAGHLNFLVSRLPMPLKND